MLQGLRAGDMVSKMNKFMELTYSKGKHVVKHFKNVAR